MGHLAGSSELSATCSEYRNEYRELHERWAQIVSHTSTPFCFHRRVTCCPHKVKPPTPSKPNVTETNPPNPAKKGSEEKNPPTNPNQPKKPQPNPEQTRPENQLPLTYADRYHNPRHKSHGRKTETIPTLGYQNQSSSEKATRTSKRSNRLLRLALGAPETSARSFPNSMANHCLSWQVVHSTSFSPISRRLLPPQARQATRSASLKPRLEIVAACGLSFTARRRSTTSVGEAAPDFRLTWRLGNRRTSAKLQRTKKSTIRISVLSSTPRVALSSSGDCHRRSESADQTTSKNTPFTVSFRNHASFSRQRKSGVTSLRDTKLHGKSRVKFLETLQTIDDALSSYNLNTRRRNASRGS